MDLRVAQVVSDTEAEGPGRRYAVWVQGCHLACPGCCNPEMFSSVGGRSTPSERLADLALSGAGLEGISVLGGEPFEQARAVAELATLVRGRGLSVMVYTGYTLEELKRGDIDGAAELLAQTDLLVDGRFRKELPEPRRRWIGSSNQVMHFLTDRYAPDDARFLMANTVELRLERGVLTVNGWPQGSRVLVRK
jgi:anaerobic ribonucleoside-triphosphate reductase activating protein